MPRKRALLIGINYAGTSHALAGCINDVDSIHALLTKNGYKDVVVMKDDKSVVRKLSPTRNNIITQLKEFCRLSKPGDRSFFHYSGHGTYTFDHGGDEADKRDEAICPSGGGVITDDEMRMYLIDRLPVNVKLFMLLDCCHSGTGADLRHNYEDVSVYGNGKGRLPEEYVEGDWTHKFKGRVNARNKEAACVVVCISGCRDKQTSADTVFDKKPCGAMTAVFTACFERYSNNGSVNLTNLLQGMTCMLRCYRYGQRPQMSLSRRASANLYEKKMAYLML
jgi:hypothetical protein